MKKKKTKNLAAVAIALFGFTIIGTNVVAGYENLKPAPPPGGGGGGGTYCYWMYVGYDPGNDCYWFHCYETIYPDPLDPPCDNQCLEFECW